MAHRKAGGSAKNLSDSNAQYLGVKLFAGQVAKPGSVIIRQRGTATLAGENVRTGKDHTLYAVRAGVVSFGKKRLTHFDGKVVVKKTVNVR